MSVRHPSRRRSVIALVLLAVVVTAMAVVIRNSGAGQPLVDPTAPPTQGLAGEPTLLVQVRDDGLTSVDNVVMGLDAGSERGSSLYLPQSLVVDLVEGRDETLGLTGFKPIAEAGPLVAAQTGVRVDDAFVLDRLAFAGLVDSVGGITLDIAEPLVIQDRWGTVVDVIPLGERTLDGPQAATYALYLGPSGSEDERQARFQAVWEELLAALPENPDQMRAILASLGALSRSTNTLASLADFLTAAGEGVRSGGWTSENLPTRPGAYGPLPLDWVDPQPAETVVEQLFPSSLLAPDSPPIRVRVYQAGGVKAELDEVRNRLVEAGFSFVWAGPGESRTESRIAVADPGQIPFGEEVAATLDLPASAVEVDQAATPGTPVTLWFVADVAESTTESAAPTATVTSSDR